jgi:hypothetical protein
MPEPSQAFSSSSLDHSFKCHPKAAVTCVYFKISSINANSLLWISFEFKINTAMLLHPLIVRSGLVLPFPCTCPPLFAP